MQKQAHVIIIGGGVVGAPILYHLSKLGCSDAIMLERPRSEFTSGSTWHATGGMQTINGDPNVAKLQEYTRGIFTETGDLSGQDIGMTLAIVGRVSYTGDLEYEIWITPSYLNIFFDQSMTAHAANHIRLFSSSALNALRLKNDYKSRGREYRPPHGPAETGLDAFVAFDKPAIFIGKSSALAEQGLVGTMRLCSFVIVAKDADVISDEPVAQNGTVVGWVTSGGFSHCAGKSMAQGNVPKNIAADDTGWSVELLGQILPAKRQKFPLFDSNASQMRS